MVINGYPEAYQSAFRPARFTLVAVNAPAGLDVNVLPTTGNEVLGTKRIYGEGQFTVNVAPYLCAQLAPEPLCGEPMGLVLDERRYVGCRVRVSGVHSPVVFLTAGTHDAPIGATLSASPAQLTIRPREKDEIAVITDGYSVKPYVTFSHNGSEYTDEVFLSNYGAGVHTFVIDEAVVAQKFATQTGLAEEQMRAFTVVLRVTQSDGNYVYLRRNYTVERVPHTGQRLAWINRYGAVDYYTFPTTETRTLSGGRGRILSSEGWSAVTTEAERWTTLVSDYEQAETLEWLAEVLSSPRVWAIEGSVATEIDVADGAVSFDPSKPGNMTLRVRPREVAVSRKF
ncbi:MAG: hypothetical protein LBM63_03030 [Rikenellaceae bacterium]|jgi:hypothetical protein|nr:hypothetical protein [Rikenellaceae bacterium]